jgi:molybdate transport system permease protein
VSGRGFGALQGTALALTLAFLLLPLVAIVARPGPAEIVRQLGSDVVLDAVLVTLKTSVIAHLIVLAVGTPAAYLIATRRFPGRELVISVVELPLVLPPAVAGIGMLAAFGRRGLLGDAVEAAGVSISFTQIAVVMAVIFVSAPFHIRGSIASFEAIDADLVAAARTLGARPARVFWRIALPLAATGLGAASTLAFARGLGEFGATIIFAGAVQGRTQTLPLAIYAELDRDLDRALAIGALLIVASILILLASKVVPRWARSSSTSPSLAATSGSSST